MRIRTIERKDKRQVLNFTRHTWEWGDYINEVFDDWCNDGLFIGAELDGKVVGIMHVAFLADGSAWFEGGRVHPKYRRQGIATALSTAAAKMVRTGPIRAMVDETNVASTHLLGKFGARQIMGYRVYEGCLTTGKVRKRGRWATQRDVLAIIDHAKRLNHDWFYVPWKWQRLNEVALVNHIDQIYITPSGLAVIEDFGGSIHLAPQFYDTAGLEEMLRKAGEVSRSLHGKEGIAVHLAKDHNPLGPEFSPIVDLVVYEMNRAVLTLF